MYENNLIPVHSNLDVEWPQSNPTVPIVHQDCTNGTGVVPKSGREHLELEQKTKKLGRPVSITEAYKYILARDGALKYAEVIASDAVEAKNARDRLAAVAELTDRLEGKATQRIDTRGVFVVLAPEAGNLSELDKWAEE